MKLLVFGQGNCIGCDELQAYLKEKHSDIKYSYTNIKELKNIKYIKMYGIEITPTVIVWDEHADEEFVRHAGFTSNDMQSIDGLLDLI